MRRDATRLNAWHSNVLRKIVFESNLLILFTVYYLPTSLKLFRWLWIRNCCRQISQVTWWLVPIRPALPLALQMLRHAVLTISARSVSIRGRVMISWDSNVAFSVWGPTCLERCLCFRTWIRSFGVSCVLAALALSNGVVGVSSWSVLYANSSSVGGVRMHFTLNTITIKAIALLGLYFSTR